MRDTATNQGPIQLAWMVNKMPSCYLKPRISFTIQASWMGSPAMLGRAVGPPSPSLSRRARWGRSASGTSHRRTRHTAPFTCRTRGRWPRVAASRLRSVDHLMLAPQCLHHILWFFGRIATGSVAAKRRDSIAQCAAQRSTGLSNRKAAVALKGRHSATRRLVAISRVAMAPGITPFQGYGVVLARLPRVAPWAIESRTFGATET